MLDKHSNGFLTLISELFNTDNINLSIFGSIVGQKYEIFTLYQPCWCQLITW